MIQIVNGLEISLAEQCFEDRLFAIKQQNHSFSKTDKKFKFTANTWRVFQLIETVISSALGQIHIVWKILSKPT